MKINDLFTEDQNLEEGPIGNAVAAGVRGVSKGIGATVGGIRGAWDAAKQGYQAGRAAVSGVGQSAQTGGTQQAAQTGNTQQSEPAQTGGVQQTTQQATPAQTGNTQQDPTAQIKAEISRLDDAGKQDVMTAIQQSLQQSAQTSQSTQNTQTSATQTPQQTQTSVAAGPQKGQEVNLSGTTYRWLGAQWAEVNPATGKAGKVAEKGIVNALNQLANQGQQTGGTPNLSVMQGGKSQQAAESYKFESKFLGMMI